MSRNMNAVRRKIFAGLVLVLVLVLGLGLRVACAHELGTLRTTVTFEKQGRYTADIIVDREHLPPGFSASAPKALPLAPVLSLPPGFSPDVLATLTAVLYASQP